MNDNVPPLTKATLDALRIAGLTREEICEELGISLGTLKRYIKALGVVARPPKDKPKPTTKREKPRYVPLDEGISLMDRCKQVLGPRMSEDHRGYVLDGRPASSIQVIRSAGFSNGQTGKLN